MLEKLLRLTAWTMTAPTAFSFFHIAIVIAGTLSAFLLANVCSYCSDQHSAARHYSNRHYSNQRHPNQHHSGQAASIRPERVLFSCGVLLLAMECYKQAFLYVIVNQRHYDWWYFPFQLCSVPMYLCLLYPLLPQTGLPADGAPARAARLRTWHTPMPAFSAPFSARLHAGHTPIPAFSAPFSARRTVATFLQDFGMLGGVMALLFPEGFLTPWRTLTFHGFFWHFILIFLAVYCRKTWLSDLSERGFVRTLPLYLICCLIASAINTAVQLTVYPRSYADLFYINCFFPSEQPVFRDISLVLGNPWGHAAYLLASCIGAGLIHQASTRLTRSPSRKQNQP